ncbi:MAG: hypothetical protein HXY52_02390 [Nitrospirae bacterium]|jgi:hypothetical protein|nr:hypothetical protein [Nitrospirota bacterium]
MNNYKEIVIRGIFYLKNGFTDFDNWSKKIIEDFGKDIQSDIRYVRKWSVAIMEASLTKDYEIKLNCWEFMGCKFGRYFKENNCYKDSDPCPAILPNNYNGINDGLNAGRSCWLVLNTRCYGNIQNNFTEKIETCSNCDFYKLVSEEEGIKSELSRFSSPL